MQRTKKECPNCKNLFSSSNLHKHYSSCSGLNFGYKPWNKGLTKDTDNRIKKASKQTSTTLKKKIRSGSFIPNKMGIEARKRLSERQSLKNSGGKSKWYEVSGQKVQGTWERNVAMKFVELGIQWYKPKVGKDVWKYTIDGLEKSYTPDFYLPDFEVYLEIKGYWWGNDREKMSLISKQHTDKRLIIITKKEYEEIINQGIFPWDIAGVV